MPLHVEIKINDRKLNQIHIGRLKGDTQPDSINTYTVVLGTEPTVYAEWAEGVTFTHRYGDGAEVCVMKAIQALKEAGLLLVVN